MEHPPVTHINPTMAHPRRIISALEKDQIAGLRIAGRRTDVIEPLGPQAAHIPAGMIDHPGHIAGAVKGCGRAGAAPYIGIADIFLGLGENGGKGFVIQILPGNLVPLGLFGVLADILGAGE